MQQQQQQQEQQHRLISSNQPSADRWSGCKQQTIDQQKQLLDDNQLQFMSCRESCSLPLARTHHSPTNTSASSSSSSSVCTVPVRDAASLKAVRYGPGHEKFPSWPGEGAHKEDGPHPQPARSKSWTDQTNYPKERQQPLARPKPQPFTQQLKTVMERCEKLPADMFETGGTNRQPAPLPPQGGNHRPFPLPRLDRDGKVLGEDRDYSVPSPPERDLSQLTRADLEEYARVYHHDEESADYAQIPTESHLTRAELEQYTRAYEDSNSLRPSHQTQASYAQSEGYHSYVSSTDSTTTTPFLDRLRRDSEAAVAVTRCSASSGSTSHESSSASSGSSSETLKWHGSLSDVSSVSSGSAHASAAAHAIAHSSRVTQPQRHHSESVLYLSGGAGGPPPAWVQRNNQINNHMRRLFPVSTYTVQPNEDVQTRSPAATSLSVAERINELERQQRLNSSLKEQRCTDHAALKAFQKKALLSFFERHHSAWKSEPQLMATNAQAAQSGGGPPVPPLRPKGPPAGVGAGTAVPQQQQQQPSRRSSSASDYAGAAWREMSGSNKETRLDSSGQREIRHQHSSSCGSLSTAVLGPIIVGPSISVDDWVPARPPKKPHLRAAYGGAPPNPPSPDLPPPSPPPVDEEAEVFISNEPLPPPPSEDQFEWLSKPQKQNHNLPPQSSRSQFYTSTSPQQTHKHPPSGFVDSRRSNATPLEVTQDSKSPNSQEVVRNDANRYSNSSSQMLNPGRTSLNYVDKSKPNLSQEVSRNEFGKHSSQMMNTGGGLLNSSHSDRNKSNSGHDSSRNEFSASQGRHKNSSQSVNPERPVHNSSYVENSRTNVHSKSPPFDKSKSSQEGYRNEYGKHNSSSQMLNMERTSSNSSYFDSSKANISQESSRNDYSKHTSSSQLVHSERVAAMNSMSSTSNKRSPSTYYENQIDMLRQSLQQSLPIMAEPQSRVVTEVETQETCNHRLENHDNQRLDKQSLRSDNQNHHPDSRLDNQPHLNNQNHQEPPRKNSQHDLHHAQIYNQNSYNSAAAVVSSGSGKERLRNKADVINGVESRLQDCSKVGEGVVDSKLTEGLVPVMQKTTWKAYSDQYQPRSLDSNLSVDSRYETQNSKPGPQAPVDKSGGVQKSPQKIGSEFNALKARIQNEVTGKTNSFRKNSFSGRKSSGGEEGQVQSGFASIKNVFQQCSERNSFRISTTAQKLLVDGKIANAVQKGTISPTHRYAPGSGQLTPGSAHFTSGTPQITPSSTQFQRASIRRSKIEHVPAATVHSSQLQYARNHVEPVKAAEERRLPPTLPPHCPPTSHQRSQSKASAYLAYRREPRERERGLPNFTGSYKRTMSPSGGQIKSINNIENQDTIKDKPPVSHTPTALDDQSLDNNHLNNNNSVNNNNHHLQTTDKKPVLPTAETKMSPSQEQQQQQRIANCQTSIVNIVNSNSGSNDIICDNSSSVRVETSSTSSLSSLSSSSSSTTRTTLPRNYSLPDQQQKRPILRTARTQSDPVNAVAVAVSPQDSCKDNVKVIRSSSSSASVNSDNSISIAINQSSSNSSVEASLKREESFQKVITVPTQLSGPEDQSQNENCLKQEESFQKVITVSRVSSPTVSVATSTSPDPDDNNQVTISSSEVSIAIGGDALETNAANEPLRLVQRTEVTLRVNAATTDAASQTEQARTPSPSTQQAAQQASSLLRLPLREEIECDQLSRDLATRLPPTHRLQGILAPGPEVKKCTDYVSGLFRLDLLPRSRTSLASSTATTTETSNCETASDTNGKVKEESGGEGGGGGEVVELAQNLSANSAYFTTSECKARLLALCNNHTQSETATSSIGPNDNLYQKKEELMCRLSRKLVVLREEAVAVVEETSLNETLGETVHARASAQGARPHELAKLRLHVKEVGHITQLLLGLSGRLARAENALLGMDTAHCDRKILEEKRDKLRAQLEEAKQLKVSIDRRSGSVSTMLYKYLTADEYADYDHFIGMKAKLLIDSREIDDKIKLGEEQLAALKEMLNETTTAR
ncbi:hypothetical protein LSTR_LSTR012210 [Laodelphax striatellus]|uniref:ASD2 domain-containing protein n=1 Tax=Laodelphax striatellus TaxID=195883 RepID=A0A482XQA1_LAOST|nr:hypothetical protein LSTR_LSTR012210 [Laodelphax striatellus]